MKQKNQLIVSGAQFYVYSSNMQTIWSKSLGKQEKNEFWKNFIDFQDYPNFSMVLYLKYQAQDNTATNNHSVRQKPFY